MVGHCVLRHCVGDIVVEVEGERALGVGFAHGIGEVTHAFGLQAVFCVTSKIVPGVEDLVVSSDGEEHTEDDMLKESIPHFVVRGDGGEVVVRHDCDFL